MTLAERIEQGSIPEPNSGCWLWLGAATSDKYGHLTVAGRQVKAHRASYLAFNDDIPAGMYVLHKCDVMLCVNPAHLFLGTHDDNMKDMAAKGRAKGKAKMLCRGVLNEQAKLTLEDARAIRARPMSGRKMAAHFSVSYTTIQNILRGRIWRDA